MLPQFHLDWAEGIIEYIAVDVPPMVPFDLDQNDQKDHNNPITILSETV